MLGIPTDVAVLLLAMLVDVLFRELPSRFHPTVWMGKSVSLAERAAPQARGPQLVFGTLMALA